MKHYIGIDLGTSAMKLILLREDGVICNTVSKEYPIAFPKPGWSEQNPEDWKAALLAGVPELIRGMNPLDLAGMEYRFCRFYRSEASVDEGRRAGKFCADS